MPGPSRRVERSRIFDTGGALRGVVGGMGWQSRSCGRVCRDEVAEAGYHFRAERSFTSEGGGDSPVRGSSGRGGRYAEAWRRVGDIPQSPARRRYTPTITWKRFADREPSVWNCEQQDSTLDTLLVAGGGGGLIGGIASWYAGNIRLVGVEPEAAPALTKALRAGHPVDSEAGGIAADSLAPKRVGELMFPIAQA